MALSLSSIGNLLKNCLFGVMYTLLGIFVFSVMFILAVFLSPLYIYRIIITKVVAPRFRPAVGKAVTVIGQFLATELQANMRFHSSPKLIPRSSRSTIICASTFPGTISLEKMSNVITKGWLTVKEGESELRYPEFQQYIERWMGFMFWIQDQNFALENHLQVHVISKEATLDESENTLNHLTEVLLNKPFHPKRSPWEINVLQNYKNPMISDSNSSNDLLTVVLFRIHHAMGDGYSILHAVFEGLSEQPLHSVKIAKPKNIERSVQLECCGISRFVKWIDVTCRLFYDMGYLISAYWKNRRSSISWYVTDDKKEWTQLYNKSKLIPVEKIKLVKNHFGVSFTSVLLSCIAAGTVYNFKSKAFKCKNEISFGTMVPLGGHPNKLRNHAVGTMFELNVDPNLTPVERLHKVDQDFADARYYSQLPLITWLFLRSFSSHVTCISRFLCRNGLYPAGLTNFPGPGSEVNVADMKLLALDACAGGLEGVAGVIFTVVSYRNYVRVAVTTEGAAMNRLELQEMIKSIESELDTLHEHVVKIAEMKEASNEQ